MTKSEMTKLFAAMSLIYRHDKMFSAGIEALKPTIEIWTATLPDLSFALGQQALIRLFRTCKYPPTPAELEECAASIRAEINAQCDSAIQMFRTRTGLFGETVEECFAGLPKGDLARLAIEHIGGPERLYEKLEKGGWIWNWTAFEKAYTEICLGCGPALPDAKAPALPSRKG